MPLKIKTAGIQSRVSHTRSLVEQADVDLDRGLRISKRGKKLALFTSQFSTLLNAGVPIIPSLYALLEQTDDPVFAQAIESIADRVQNGQRLSRALSHFSGIFSPIFTSLVAVGENTGALVASLERLAEVLIKEDRLNSKVRGALTYPIFILCVTGVLTLLVFRYVLPTFVDLFDSAGGELPLPTQVVLFLTRCVSTYWFWPLALSFCWLGWRQANALWRHPKYRLSLFRMAAATPLVGPILRFSTLARYCWVLQLCTATGVDLLSGFQLATEASNSPVLQADLRDLQASVRNGETVSDHMERRPWVYPNLLRQFTLLGEEAADLSHCFGSAANWFEEEMEMRIDIFKGALEPILMGVIGLVMGGVLLSIFLPLYGLLDKLA